MAAVSSSVNATSRDRPENAERTTRAAVIRLTSETNSWTSRPTTQSTVRRNVLSVNKSSVPLRNDGLSNRSTDVFSSNSTTASPSGITASTLKLEQKVKVKRYCIAINGSVP